MELEQRIKAFVNLGKIFNAYIEQTSDTTETAYEKPFALLDSAISQSHYENPWFTPEFIKHAISVWGNSMNEENIRRWLQPYTTIAKTNFSVKNAGVIMPGNLPLAGFHDFLCVLISGNKFTGKLSTKDKYLLPAIAQIMIYFDKGFEHQISFTDSKITGFDFVIATGSGNTSRYFEYYFGKYPHIIRKNRISAAVLTGEETSTELEGLIQDVFMYFGMGCRSISKIFVPEGYDFQLFYEACNSYEYVSNHNKYLNNYEYYKAIYLINKDDFLDNGFLLIKKDLRHASPVSVLYYDTYKTPADVNKIICNNINEFQCICSGTSEISGSISLGNAQNPKLQDYADDIDTLKFILDLEH